MDWRGFYAILDPAHVGERDPREVAAAILQGGCTALQLRDKRGDDRALLALAEALRTMTREARVPLVINDRVDIARLVDADGLHLGQDDVPLAAARTIFAGTIGVSTHGLAQARAAVAEGADLIGFGPVFETKTKSNPDPVVGLDGLREVCAAVDVPVVAIGGVTPERATDLREAGASMAASIGAVCGASDPAGVARSIHEVWS